MSMSSMRDDKSNSKAKSYNFHYPNQRAKAKPIHNEPPDKRRRVDHNMPNAGQNAAKSGLGVQAGGTDDLWDDDDLDFMTQDQFENIDHEIALSQQVTTAPRSMIEDKSKSSLGRTVGRGMGRSHSANDVVQKSREMLQKKGSSSLSGAMQGGHQHNSKENECTKYRSPAYPSTATMGGVRSERYRTPAKSYTSKPCTGTGDMQQKVSAGGAVSTKSQLTPTAGTTCSGQFSPALPGGHARTDFPDIFKNKMAHLKEELELYKKEVKKLQTGALSKDGQIKILRTTMEEQKAEIVAKKQERVQFIEQQAFQIAEKEKTKEKEMERLRTQLQFKEQDIVELQGRCKLLERSRNTSSSECLNSPSRPQVQSLPVLRSPRLRMDPKSPSRPTFPSRATFMAHEHNSESGPSKIDVDVTKPVGGKSISAAARPHQDPWTPPKFNLRIPNSKGYMPGPLVVGKMLAQHSKTETALPQGIMGLLQIPPHHHDLQDLGLHRDAVTRTFSPAKTKRWIQNMQSYGASTLPQRSGGSIVPEEHYRLAVHAVASLLHQDHRDHTTVPHILLTGNTEEAVLLLPIIENYLTHYLHLVRSAGDAGSPSQVSTIPSCGSSGESSPDSVTSHLRALMYDGATYANHMEKCTLNALWMLKVLVDYSGHVRNSLCDNASMECATSNDLMQRTSGTSSTLTAQTSGTAGSTPTVNKEPSKSSPSHAVAGPSSGTNAEQCPESSITPDGVTCSSGRSPTSRQAANQLCIGRVVRESQLLAVLIQLANPALPNGQSSCAEVFEVCLEVLATLAARCSPSHFVKFELLFRQETLLNCLLEGTSLEMDQRLGCHLAAIKMLSILCHSPEILPKLCSTSENCILLAVYALATAPQLNQQAEHRLLLNIKVIQLLTDIMSLNAKGIGILFESDCQCSVNVVKTVILMLYQAFQEYRQQKTPGVLCLRFLREGVCLLHSMALHDRLFTQHRREVEDRYIEVVVGLDNLFREAKEIPEHDLDALQALWDFEFDYPGGVQDGEDGADDTSDTTIETMDTS